MIELSVRGMTCQGCVRSVEKAVGRVEGVQQVRVDLDQGRVQVEGPADRDAVVEAIRKAGFET